MSRTRSDESTRTATTTTSDAGVYLPAMPALSASPGRVERFLTRLLRRRGGLRVVVGADRSR